MKRGANRIIVLLCAACLLSAAGAGAQTPAARPPRLAVLGFVAQKDNEAETMGRLNARLHAEFEQLALFQCLPPAAVAAARNVFRRDTTAVVDEQCVQKIGRALRAQVIAVGSLQKVGGAYAVEVRLVHAASGRIVQSVREEFFGTLAELTQHLPVLVHRLIGVTTSTPDPLHLACACPTALI